MLTLASINAEAFVRTRATRKLHLYSRSRDELWRQGATPGNKERGVLAHLPERDPRAAGRHPSGAHAERPGHSSLWAMRRRQAGAMLTYGSPHHRPAHWGARRPGFAQPAAPHALRAAAGVLDFGLIMVLAGTTSEPFPLAIPIALFVAYHTLAVWLTGQTIGKAVFGLRVVRPTRPRTLLWSLGRSTIGYFGCTLLGLGPLVAARDSRHRALHDLVFGSQVVETGSGRLGLRSAAVRLADFARMRGEETEKRRTAAGVAVLTFLLGWLQSVANTVVGVVDRLSELFGGSASGGGPSPLAKLGTTAKAGLGVLATGVSMAVVAYMPPVADATKWLFEPRHYFYAAADSPVQGFATPEDAIRAFARAERWQEERGWNYEGSCERLSGAPRKLVCSAPWTGSSSNLRLAPGEQIYVIVPGWSDVHDGFVALKRSGAGWVVTRELTG